MMRVPLSLRRTTTTWDISSMLGASDSIKESTEKNLNGDVSFLEEEISHPSCWSRIFNIFSRCFRC